MTGWLSAWDDRLSALLQSIGARRGPRLRHVALTFARDEAEREDDNQDHLLCAPRAGIYVVADGIGGCAGGREASRAATAGLMESLLDQPDEHRQRSAALTAALDAANRRVCALRSASPELAKAGTTLSAVVLHARHGAGIHIGDSRVLRLRAGRLVQLSSEHTVAAEMEKVGRALTRERRRSLRHMLFRYLGSERPAEPQLLGFGLQRGDWLVVCSDGLRKVVRDPELTDALTRFARAPIEDLGAHITALATSRRRPDDLTAIFVRVER